MSEEKKKKIVKPVKEVKLRTYPKIIFLWPLLFTSLICWIVQGITSAAGGEPLQGLGYFWFIVLFCNLFVMAFDFGSAKFFILILTIVIIILVVIFFVLPMYDIITVLLNIEFNLKITAEFYMSITIMLAIILFFVWLAAQFDYYKVERNEIYHKKGLFHDAERFPVKSLRIKKEIPDVFEFMVLRAGSISLMPGRADEVIHLNTVLNVNKKSEQIDYLLSEIAVEPDDI